MRTWLAVFALLLAACGGAASPDVTKVRDPASVTAGDGLYAANCALCHGADADGGRVPGGGVAPSLVSRKSLSDELLVEIIKRGRGFGMPSFNELLAEEEIRSIVDYVRSLQAADLEQ